MRKLGVICIVLVVAAFACAKENGATPSPSASAGSSGISGKVNNHGTKTFTKKTFTLELEADNDGSDFYFKPTIIKAKAQSVVTIHLKNEGSVQHNLKSRLLGLNITLQPGATQTIQANLGSTPNVPFYCKFHKDQGMQGTFELS